MICARDIVGRYPDSFRVWSARRSNVSRESTSRPNSCIICYGMGLTQHRLRHAKRAAGRQPAADARAISAGQARGSARCAVIPTCRATARGNHRDPERRVAGPASRRCSASAAAHHGHAVVDSLQAMIDGRAKVFIGLGGNFVAATPDTESVRAAMRRLKLTVGITTKLNRSHIVHGEEALILPCLARSEIDVQATGRAERDRRGQHVHGARFQWPGDAAVAASEIRSFHHLRHGARYAAGQRHRLGRDGSRLRADP